jgi:hypothetical protein
VPLPPGGNAGERSEVVDGAVDSLVVY